MIGDRSKHIEPLDGAVHSLPSVVSYLRAVLALGWSSLRSSWPLLVVITFVEQWLESYVKLMREEGQMSPSWLLGAALLGGTLVFLEAPLLLLQDSALRGSRRSLWDSCRATWARLPAFLACLAVEGVIFGVLPLLFFVAPLTRSSSSSFGPLTLLSALWAIAGLTFLAVGVVLTRFAEPLVLLDSKRPLDAILMSVRMVASQFGGVLGRWLMFCVCAAIPYALLLIAFFLLGVLMDQWGAKTFEVVPVVLYEFAATAFLASCTVSAQLILFRSLKPPEAVLLAPAVTSSFE